MPLTLTAYFVQAAVAAIRAVPEANSRWTDRALEIYESINIGIATAVEGTGLVVPVLQRRAARATCWRRHAACDDLVDARAAGKLTPADVRGGTFTHFQPRRERQPARRRRSSSTSRRRRSSASASSSGARWSWKRAAARRIVVRPRCYVTLTLDHRVMDGHQANRFLQTFVQKLTGWSALVR